MGKDPVVVAIFASVDDIGEDFVFGFDAFPEEAEDTAGHVWVANEVVWFAQDFFFGVEGNAEEDAVGVSDFALGVGFGYDEFVGVEETLVSGEGDVFAHWMCFHV